MARSILVIYNEMVAEKETLATLNSLQPAVDSAQDLLSDLTTPSKVAAWRLIFFVTAVGIWSVELLFDKHVLWIEQRAKELAYGNIQWYVPVALEFQYGDSLVWNGKKYLYDPLLPSHRIITLAAASEVGGYVILKVAKAIAGVTQKLTTPELDAFTTYVKKVKPAGPKVLIVSRDPDLLKIHYHVMYDPLILTAAGELIATPGVFPVRNAINEYCVGLPFNGVFTVTELTDRIQLATGVIDPVFDSAEVQYGIEPYTTFVDSYTPNAGYLKIDPAYPLSATITYIAQ